MSGSLRVAVRHRFYGRSRQRGAVAVEFALVVPILVMLLIGTITTGLSYSHALGVTNAVREGARFGAIADGSSGSWAGDVMDRVRKTQFDDLSTPPETTVCVQLVKLGSTPPLPICNSDGPGVTSADLNRFPLPPTTASLPAGVCVVRVVASRNFTISAPPFLQSTQKLVRGSVARYEEDSC